MQYNPYDFFNVDDDLPPNPRMLASQARQQEQWGDPQARYRHSRIPRPADLPLVDPPPYDIDSRYEEHPESRVAQLVTELRNFMQVEEIVRLDTATANMTGLLAERTLEEQVRHFSGKSAHNQRRILQRMRDVVSGVLRMPKPLNKPKGPRRKLYGSDKSIRGRGTFDRGGGGYMPFFRE